MRHSTFANADTLPRAHISATLVAEHVSEGCKSVPPMRKENGTVGLQQSHPLQTTGGAKAYQRAIGAFGRGFR